MHLPAHLISNLWSYLLEYNLVPFLLKKINIRSRSRNVLFCWRQKADGCYDNGSIVNCNKCVQFIEGNDSHLSPAGQCQRGSDSPGSLSL